jgi:hypothetical protein
MVIQSISLLITLVLEFVQILSISIVQAINAQPVLLPVLTALLHPHCVQVVILIITSSKLIIHVFITNVQLVISSIMVNVNYAPPVFIAKNAPTLLHAILACRDTIIINKIA